MNNVKTFESPYDVFLEYGFSMTAKQESFFMSVDDYCGFAYYVIDNERVIVTDNFSGNVIENMTLIQFYKDGIAYYNECETEE